MRKENIPPEIAQWNEAAERYAAEQETSEFVLVNNQAVMRRYPSRTFQRADLLPASP